MASIFSSTTIEKIGSSTPEGAVLGETTDKVGFYGTMPIVQGAALTTVATTGATSTSTGAFYGFTTSSQANSIVTQLNLLINGLSAAQSGNGLFA